MNDERRLRHVVMLAFQPGVTAEERAGIVAALRLLPDQVPGLLGIDVRTDAGLAEGNAEIFFTMTFVDKRSWRDYPPHPAHVRLAEELIHPVLRTKTAVQFWG